MKIKLIIAGILSLVCVIILLTISGNLIEYNKLENWQIVQGINGSIRVIDKPGYYSQWFGAVSTYPRTLDATFYSEEFDEIDESIRVTFNDGGTAQVSAFVKVQLPIDEKQRINLHQQFKGNPDNIDAAIAAHLTNCIKATGPIMSATENQASRKSEFNQIVEEQLVKGLYLMKRTEVELPDLVEMVDGGVDAQGNKILRERKARVAATEIVKDNNDVPVILNESPLTEQYGLTILQFSIKDIDYDSKTLEQFAAKKESYLKAEQAKAERQQEVQQKLMIEEKGRRQVAEIEAVENQKKTQAVIQAEKEREVAEVAKQKAVIEAQQKVEVAKQQQEEAETLKLIAKIKADTAELDKQAQISQAEAKEKTIQLGGGITEKERVLAEIERERSIGVAQHLANIKTPQVVFLGGKDGQIDVMSNLINLVLLKNSGIIKEEVLPPIKD